MSDKPDEKSKGYRPSSFLDDTIDIDTKFLDQFKKLMDDVTVEVRLDFEKGAADFLAKPKSDMRYPAVMVFHDVWGLNEYVKMACIRLAKYGFTALAVDLFKGNVTSQPKRAKEFMRDIEPDHDMEIIQQRFDKLKKQRYVNPRQIGTLGFLLGGYYALRAPMMIPGIRTSTAIFGRFPAEFNILEMEKLKCTSLCLAGGTGKAIYNQSLRDFRKYYEKYPEKRLMHLYDASKPTFFDEMHIDGYDPIAAQDSWDRILKFLNQNLIEHDTLHAKIKKYFGKLGGKVLEKAEDSGLGSKFLDVVEDAMGDDEEDEKK